MKCLSNVGTTNRIDYQQVVLRLFQMIDKLFCNRLSYQKISIKRRNISRSVIDCRVVYRLLDNSDIFINRISYSEVVIKYRGLILSDKITY
jgi:hypothetical protein